MKTRTMPFLACGVALVLAACFCLAPPRAAAGDDAAKFSQYRTAIKAKFGVDIRQFKDKLAGGKADGKSIIQYDLDQLLMGIDVEQEHTKNKLTALEIATDHLEEFPDYYTRLHQMEEQAEKEMKARGK